MLVVVTGATGFLGTHLVERLVADGHRVRALVRETSDVSGLEALGVGYRAVALSDGAGLSAALAGAEAVVHAAGGGRMRRVANLYRVNRDGTVALLDALRASGARPRRVVLVSSVAALGPSPPGQPRAADAPPAPVSHYGRAKAAAEAAVLAAADRWPVTVLRPPAVYGPGDTRLLGLFRAARRGVVPVLGRGRTTSLVYGPDCAAALARLVVADHPSGRVYGIDDGALHDVGALVDGIALAVGRRAVRLRLPLALVPVAAAISEASARLRRRAFTFGLDKARDLAQASWVSDGAALRAEIGTAAGVALPEGLRRTAAWYREVGWLRP